ncbi:MAG: SIR2 family protein [Mucilaginibacter sp.]
MKKIILFTGAGMCVPMGLPSALSFANTIEKCNIHLYNLLLGFLGENAKDIEQILYAIEEFVNGSNFYKFLISHLNSSQTSFKPFNDSINNQLISARRFQQEVKSDIFRILQRFDSQVALEIYLELLKSFKKLYNDFSLSIFTTNYDLVFEILERDYFDDFEKLGYKDISYGFKSKRNVMQFDRFQDLKWENDIIEYNKLHGSLDWTKDNKGHVIKTGAVTIPAVPDDMPLLYPGYKGTPTGEPFISMHNKLYYRLVDCDVVYVVGFAFRDPYINSIFEFALRGNKNLKINCFNPLPIEKLPTESAIPQMVKSFPKQFIYNQRGIECKDNPLGIPLFQ